jgi:uncharacterized SAM-binding protein YcdF (DUF218 family)
LKERSAVRLFSDPHVIESLAASVVILVLTGGLTLLLSWLRVWRWALVRNRKPDQGHVLVFGHQLRQGQPSPDYIARLRRGARLLEASPGLRLVLLGGGAPSEAAVGRDWLLKHTGLDPDRIELEEDSIDSLENLRHARDMIGPGTPVYLVSSRYHLGRLRVLSRQLGMQAELVPAEPWFFPGLRNLLLSIQEAAYVCWFVSGRFWARLAGRDHLLKRIE